MRLQTRLFLGAASLVVAMAAAQWFIVGRQLKAVEHEVGAVASSVSEELLASPVFLLRGDKDGNGQSMVWVGVDGSTTSQSVTKGDPSLLPESLPTKRVHKTVEHIQVKVEADVDVDRSEERRFLVVRSGDNQAKVRIPTSPVTGVVRRGLRESLFSSGLLLLVGLLGAAVMAQRVSRPLRQLSESADAVARGNVGTQVEVTGAGEVAELESAFNRMSTELERLEKERERWQAREHLAQLGEIARGLAHTIRNPLNTLGLTVDELTRGGGDGDRETRLAATARVEIQRIDRWMRSFLAVAAGDGAEAAQTDAGGVVRDAVLEAVQRSSEVEIQVEVESTPLPVRVVPAGLRAALANLVENAVAARSGGPVRVTASRDGENVVIRIEDRGEGIPEEVRERLFRPHTTTRPEGSGMGLYLARELIRADGGSLALDDGAECGTVATVRLPLTEEAHEHD